MVSRGWEYAWKWYANEVMHSKTSPVTVVTSVPWERERDITENFSVMGTPSLQPFLKSYWLTPVNDWPIVAKHAIACKYWRARGSIKCGARDNYVRIWYWTPLSWASSEHGDLLDVSFPLSGNRGYDSNRRRSLSSFHETSRYSRYSIPPWERLRAACTSILSEDRTHTQFPPIATLVGRARSW